MDIPIIGVPAEISKTVEVCRSFSYRLNLGNYEHADFFASRKIQCAAEAAGWVSETIYEECVEEVRSAIRHFQSTRKERKTA